MHFFKQLFKSIIHYFKAFGFIHKHNLWGRFILIGLLNLLIYIGLAVLLWYSISRVNDYFIAFLGIDSLASGWQWLAWIVDIIIRLAVLYLYYLLFKFVILAFCSPVFTLLSDKVNQILYQPIEEKFNWRLFAKNIWRAIKITIFNTFKELALTGIFLLLSLIPYVGFLFIGCIFILSSYYVGYAMMDYRNEFKQLNVRNSNKMVWRNKGIALGIGSLMNAIILIPFLGVLIAPQLAIVSASTLLYEEEKNLTLR